jgi:hypothetical protein
MKKFLLFFCLAITFSSCSIEYSDAEKARRTANRQSTQAQLSAQAAVDVPDLSYFQERRTIAEWAKHWDRPSAACYVYLISYGNIIGYYVSEGKPASTGSFLTPEYSQTYQGEGGAVEQQLPDIDGTYGTNNPGIRFFTASGIAVEWAGSGASYIYSDVPLEVNAPLLGE